MSKISSRDATLAPRGATLRVLGGLLSACHILVVLLALLMATGCAVGASLEQQEENRQVFNALLFGVMQSQRNQLYAPPLPTYYMPPYVPRTPAPSFVPGQWNHNVAPRATPGAATAPRGATIAPRCETRYNQFGSYSGPTWDTRCE